MKKRDCTIYVAKTKALISFAVTAKLICVFIFAYAKSRFSHDEAHLPIAQNQSLDVLWSKLVCMTNKAIVFLFFVLPILSKKVRVGG